MRSLSCLFEELCSGRSNRGEGAMSDANGSCTNSALKKDGIKEDIIPYNMPSIVSDQKVLCCYFFFQKILHFHWLKIRSMFV